jgi:hypothetical protein
MQGVEILTSAQVATEFVFNWSEFWIVFGIVTSLVFLSSLICLNDSICVLGVLVGLTVSLILGGLVGVVIGEINGTPISYETQYKVTVSDEVSMTEFYEHYEVIEQDGKIFTIREKDNNE